MRAPKKTTTQEKQETETTLKVSSATQKIKEALEEETEQFEELEAIEAEVDDSFIVQNIMPGYLCISDIGLQFDGFQVMDLTHENPKYVKASTDLRSAIKKGYLRKISRDEWERITDKQIQKERERAARLARARQTRLVDVEGRQLETEVVNINEGTVEREEISTEGFANDSTTYAMAFAKAQEEAALRGEVLDPEEFNEKFGDNMVLMNKLIQSSRPVTSGQSHRGSAVVAQPPDGSYSTSTQKVRMSNLNRDGYLQGVNVYDAGYNNDDVPIAEEIDLAQEDIGDEGGGGIRRK